MMRKFRTSRAVCCLLGFLLHAGVAACIPWPHTADATVKPQRISSKSAATAVSSDLLRSGAASYDVVVVGGGLGGVAAATQAARQQARVLLVEETDWIGGQLSAAGVGLLDQGRFNTSAGLYGEFVRRAKTTYEDAGYPWGVEGIGGWERGVEPRAAQRVLLDMLTEAGPLGVDVLLRARLIEVFRDSAGSIRGVRMSWNHGAGRRALQVEAPIIIDATEWGDVLPLAGAAYRVGNSNSNDVEFESDVATCVQSMTQVAVIKKHSPAASARLSIETKPPGYSPAIEKAFARKLTPTGANWGEAGVKWGTYPTDWKTHVAYRSTQNGANGQSHGRREYEAMTKTSLNWANDWPVSVAAVEDRSLRRRVQCEAKMQTMRLLYYIQQVLGEQQWSLATDVGYDTPYNRDDNRCPDWPEELQRLEPFLPVIPYVRESRRLVGAHTLTAKEIFREGKPARGKVEFANAVAVGDYRVDLHGCAGEHTLEASLESYQDIPPTNPPGAYQVPMGAFYGEVPGLLVAEKNLSMSRLAAAATRTHPTVMSTGQAAGALAAVAIGYDLAPADVDPLCVQHELALHGARLSTVAHAGIATDELRWGVIELAWVLRLARDAALTREQLGLPMPGDERETLLRALRRHGSQTRSGGPGLRVVEDAPNGATRLKMLTMALDVLLTHRRGHCDGR